MDKYSGKKAGATRVITAPKKEEHKFCNRIGCSGRIKYTTNLATGKSPTSSCTTTRAKRSIPDSKRKLSSRSETSQSGDSEAHSLPAWRPPGKNSTVPSNVRPRKMIQKKTGSTNQSASPASRSSGLGTLSNSTSNRSRVNLGNTTSDSINPMKKRSQLGDSVNNGAAASSSAMRQRATNENNGRMRFSYIRQNVRNISRIRVNSSQQMNLANRPSSSSSSYSSSSSSSDENRSNMMASATGWDIPHVDHFQGYNIDPEVLLTLERIQRDEEVTNEQLLSFEESLFLNGISMSDQHRAMRLDIDNMSYEELLALGEVIGSVSTALPEEAIVQCISRSVYQTAPPEVRLVGSGEEDEYDFKCTICQEEYVGGDEIGKLVKCQHGYHTACINEWLRMKNWCPVCKAAAAPSS